MVELYRGCCARSRHQGQGQVITNTVGWNYLSLSLITASAKTLLILVDLGAMYWTYKSYMRARDYSHLCTGKHPPMNLFYLRILPVNICKECLSIRISSYNILCDYVYGTAQSILFVLLHDYLVWNDEINKYVYRCFTRSMFWSTPLKGIYFGIYVSTMFRWWDHGTQQCVLNGQMLLENLFDIYIYIVWRGNKTRNIWNKKKIGSHIVHYG